MTVELLSVGGNRLSVITLDPMHIVDAPDSIAENFDDKVKKYGSLGLPLLVAAVKHHRAEINETDIEDVLLGSFAYVSKQTTSGHVGYSLAASERNRVHYQTLTTDYRGGRAVPTCTDRYERGCSATCWLPSAAVSGS
jgi:hypothetical protein